MQMQIGTITVWENNICVFMHDGFCRLGKSILD